MALPKLSERLKKRITIKNPILFKLAGVGKRDSLVDEGNDLTLHGASYPPTTTIFDKWEEEPANRLKVVSNSIGTQPVQRDGRTVQEELLEYVRFSAAGNLVVWPHEVHKLAYLRLSDNNGSNPYRDQTKPVLWLEADSPDQELRSLVREEDLQLEAQLLIINMPFSDLKAFAAEYISIVDKKHEAIRWDMRQKVKEPGMARILLANAPSEEVRMKLLVADAKALRILVYAPQQGWRFEDQEGKYFFKPEPGVVPDKALIEWLMSEEGAKRAEELKVYLKESEEA